MNQEEVHINDITKLVEFVFVENRGNNRMLIESSDFKDNRDLFFFCIELTMKGLSYLYGNENGKVDIDDLSIEQIESVKSKLANAAIELLLDIEEIEDSVNDTEIIYDIPYNQFFSFKDEDGFIYAFDIYSLYNLYIKNNCKKLFY